jgi:creatinine amidohydrolase/Fe(II)-dependent formamide hydrolase-like protein
MYSVMLAMLRAGRCAGNVLFAVVILASAPAFAQPQSVYLEDLTLPELSQRIEQGATTVIVPTGGTEQNGAHLALGKHNFVVRETAGRIARELGLTLVAPELKVVPEGPLDRPGGNLRFPGTLGLSDDSFERVLWDIALSLAHSGFKLICFVGDHGQSQAIQARVAERLSDIWRSSGIRVVNVSSYYSADAEERELVRLGLPKAALGEHGGVADTAQLMAVKPDAVRTELLAPKSWKGSGPSGASGQPELASAVIGERLLRERISAAVTQIRALRDRPK